MSLPEIWNCERSEKLSPSKYDDFRNNGFYRRLVGLTWEIGYAVWHPFQPSSRLLDDTSLLCLLLRTTSSKERAGWRRSGSIVLWLLSLQLAKNRIQYFHTRNSLPTDAQVRIPELSSQSDEDSLCARFDIAFAHEAMARAAAVAGKSTDCEKYIKLAKDAGEKIKSREDRETISTATLKQ